MAVLSITCLAALGTFAVSVLGRQTAGPPQIVTNQSIGGRSHSG